ncbi:DNA repair protein endonuclease SAE2/CtIP C-terminus-domain-containing protein [Phyllosticta citriasiana]|uniref:DNA repair protein endonuclease SAE2/CtIP C-terminus-domain-containing protein n=1 Tax=Phyllosticta citriasiana TaxID=595635 RepID=UPI0030FD2D52
MDKDDSFSQESEGSSARFESLIKAIRNDLHEQKHRTRVVERNNSSLLVRIDELEQENKGLKQQLEAALRSHSDVGRDDLPAKTQDGLLASGGEYPASSPPTTHEHSYPVSYAEWSELNRNYNLLAEQNHQRAIAQERLHEKCAQWKERAKEWEEYGAHLARKIEKIEKPRRSDHRGSEGIGPPTPASAISPPPEMTGLRETIQKSIPPGREQNNIMPPAHFRLHNKCATPIDRSSSQPSHSGIFSNGALEEPRHQVDAELATAEPDPKTSNETELQASGNRNEEGIGSESGLKEPRSSQTTQEEDYVSNQASTSSVRLRSSDDEVPEIISERTLKRKRQGAQGKSDFAVFKDNTSTSQSSSTPHVRIKEESEESVPVSQILASYRQTGSALDLDETANQLETPRKRRQFRMPAKYSRSKRDDIPTVPLLRQERSFSAPAEFNRRVNHKVPRAGRDKVTVRAEEIPDSDSESLHIYSEDEENFRNSNFPIPSPRSHRNTKPLVQVDANPRVPLPKPQFNPRPEKRRENKYKGAQAINTVSESSEELAPESEMAPEVRKESRRRLTGLLGADTSLESRMLAKPSTPASSRFTRPAHNPVPSVKTPQSEPVKKKTLISTPQTASKMPQSTSKRLLERNFQPLRSKPLEQLSVNDFKINPAVNHGVAFVYNQVVRNREARRCMPGCIREECCGPTFRAIVESGVDPPEPQDLWKSPETDVTKDDKYLRACLGSTYNKETFKLKPLAEQQTLLETAKMKAWANSSGRHKQAFQRERTPPGFWRTDFPGTQEAQQDREAARMEERRLVEERWREAMTEGGRWLFRDE